MKREQLSPMHKYQLILLSCVWLGFGGEGPPACEPLTYFGVQGCQLSAQGSCPKGYHKQLACPTNPMIKAPCRQMCVGDPVPGKKVMPRENRSAAPGRKPAGCEPGSDAGRPKTKECKYPMHKHFEGGNRDAIIATITSVSASRRDPSAGRFLARPQGKLTYPPENWRMRNHE